MIGPRTKPKDFPRWMAYVVIWGLLAPVLMAAVVEAVVKIIIGTYTGTTNLAPTTSGTLWTASMAIYYAIQVRFTWYAWFVSLKVGNVKQRAKQAAAYGSIAANVKTKGDVSISNHYTSPIVELREKPAKPLEWRRLPDNDTFSGSKSPLGRGHIYQFAVVNNTDAVQLLWEAELVAVQAGSVRHYEAAFAEHGSKEFIDRSLRVEGKDAHRVQFRVDAAQEDVAAFAEAWLYLRFKTTRGPDYVLIQQGTSDKPSENDILRGLRAPTPT